ncbi:succinylglutamate desuccinylase/aspartoacylase family protein [Rivibacter subsaxonicus]|uniref:Succinylglutamate desuccinylase/Aspartoacylase catalytic domain-containing protein n=1 Tax=Rivibacter subsaxonicus TaxID=457575 RepID=A0A4Q7W0J4_9BURK|nr:succinylglutamate desuccinylase/aspartoacylase family protein [Rivibacter subsaxonicus]RZU02620.1 hypothetical protein EV670_0648 [Rivibacter subsaxonicus]
MQIHRHPLLSQSLGTHRELVSFHYGTPDTGPKVYIQASLHADELPGMLVAHHLRERLAALEAKGALRGEVVVVPVANPLGLSQRVLGGAAGRFDLQTGENFNRHYPSLGDAVWAEAGALLGSDAEVNVQRIRAALRACVVRLPAATELQSMRRTLLALACDAEIVLDLHCDHEAVLHLYTGTALWPQAEALARCLGAEVSLLAADSGDQPFDEACSQLWWEIAARAGTLTAADGRARPVPPACLAATVELRGEADVSHAQAASDAQALLDFLTHRRVIDGLRTPLPPLRREPTPLAGSEPVTSPVSGVIAWHKAPGDWVARGETVAEVIDPISATVTPLTSATDGVLYARENRRFAVAGMRLAKVAGTLATRTGKLLSA